MVDGVSTADHRSSNHRNALDLDHEPGAREVRYRDERAGGIAFVGKALGANLHEPVAIARIGDEDGHGDEIRQAAAHALQGAVDQRECRSCLCLEITRNLAPLQIDRCGLTGQPDDAAALRHDGRAVSPGFLPIRTVEILDDRCAWCARARGR